MDAIESSALNEGDKTEVFELLQDPDVMRYLGPRRPLTDSEAQAWFDEARHTPSRLVFRHCQSQQLIGFCGIKQIDGEWDFGYFLRRPFWGQGYASRMCQIAIAELAPRTDFTRLHLFIADDNTGSLKVANRLGWQRIGDHHNGYEQGALFRIPSDKTP
uniref:GNAT family N-acetyltransferase n=1 Tax=Thaumasiovibrio occultus TaxID=1891184 RepID=UPI000B34D8EB|nr:GNAT family N-acetyltransferase [Thaumasiovibrio occultus]